MFRVTHVSEAILGSLVQLWIYTLSQPGSNRLPVSSVSRTADHKQIIGKNIYFWMKTRKLFDIPTVFCCLSSPCGGTTTLFTTGDSQYITCHISVPCIRSTVPATYRYPIFAVQYLPHIGILYSQLQMTKYKKVRKMSNSIGYSRPKKHLKIPTQKKSSTN